MAVNFIAPDPASITSEAESVMEYVAQYSANVLAPLNDFINGLLDAQSVNLDVGPIPGLGFSVVDHTTPLDGLTALKPAAPTLDFATLQNRINAISTALLPAAPTLPAITATIPALTATSPIISFPTLPTLSVPSLPVAPIVTDTAIPDAPTVTLPAVPTIGDLVLPEAPSISLPSLTAIAPINTLTAPTDRFNYAEAVYTSALKDPLIAKLLSDLANGGYGIDPVDETRLWDRARDREFGLMSQASEDIQAQMEATSFPVPQGAFFTALRRAQNETQAKLSAINRDIAIKRAELYVDNRRFTIEQVRSLEQIQQQFFNAVQGRALDAARAQVELGIAVFDAAVRNFNAQLDAYKTEASVFRDKIQAALATLELYKGQLQGATLRLEADRTRVALYEAQLTGVNSVIQVFRSRMEAARLAAEIQAQKLEGYRTQVQAYSALVQSEEIKFRAYDSAIQGEGTKIELYKSQIGAYAQQVDAEKAKGELTIQNSNQLVRAYEVAANSYRLQLDSLLKQVEGESEIDKLKINSYQADVQAFSALVSSIVQSSSVKIQNQESNNSWNKEVVRSKIETARLLLEKLVQQATLIQTANRAGSAVFSQVASAALGSMNGIATHAG